MSQVNVERVIGVLITDEAFRRRFAEDPKRALQNLAESGIELTEWERRALATLDPVQLDRFADAIDARLQKCDLKRGGMQS
jgi:hypothetical protein